MPANVNQEYTEAEEKYSSSSAISAKIAALQEMLRTIPKHKGTEKMQLQIKRKLAKLRQEQEGPAQWQQELKQYKLRSIHDERSK